METARQEERGKRQLREVSYRTCMNEKETKCRYNSCDCRVSFDGMTSLPNIRDLSAPS